MLNRRYVELVLYKTYAELRVEAERTYAGYIWWVAEPVLHMIIYYLVFGVFFRQGTPNYVPFLFVGLVAWRWLQSTLMEGSNAIIAGRALIQQVYIPKVLLPLVTVLANTFRFLCVLVVLIVFLHLYGLPATWSYLALPAVLLAQFAFVASITLFFAGFVPFFPDLRIFIDSALRAWFFLSVIFYGPQQIPQPFRDYLYLNPMVVLIEGYRNVLMRGMLPSWQALAGVIATSILLATGAILWIRRHDCIYPKLPL